MFVGPNISKTSRSLEAGREATATTHHLCGGLRVLCSHVLLQGDFRVAHPATVWTCEGLGLLHRHRFSAVVQVWGGESRQTFVNDLWFSHTDGRC